MICSLCWGWEVGTVSGASILAGCMEGEAWKVKLVAWKGLCMKQGEKAKAAQPCSIVSWGPQPQAPVL